LLESQPKLDPTTSFTLACNLSLASSLIGSKAGTRAPEDKSKLTGADQKRYQLYGERAMAALTNAADGGFIDLDVYRTDSDLDPLRARPDFKKLIKKISETQQASPTSSSLSH
jgi:hypothetical protein